MRLMLLLVCALALLGGHAQADDVQLDMWLTPQSMMAYNDVASAVGDMRNGIDPGSRVQALFNRYVYDMGKHAVLSDEALERKCATATIYFWGVDTSVPTSEMSTLSHTWSVGGSIHTSSSRAVPVSIGTSSILPGRGLAQAAFNVEICNGMGSFKFPWRYARITNGVGDIYVVVCFHGGETFFPNQNGAGRNEKSIDIRSKVWHDLRDMNAKYMLILAVAK